MKEGRVIGSASFTVPKGGSSLNNARFIRRVSSSFSNGKGTNENDELDALIKETLNNRRGSDVDEEVGNKKKNNKREFDVDEEVGNKEKTHRQKESSPRGLAVTAEAVKDPTSDDKEDSFDDLHTTEAGQATSESELDSHFQKNAPKKQQIFGADPQRSCPSQPSCSRRRICRRNDASWNG